MRTVRISLIDVKDLLKSMFNLIFSFLELKLFKCTTEMGSKMCEPEAIIKINTDLYLVCDKFFGIFIDSDGKRLKYSEIIKWPLPLNKIGTILNKKLSSSEVNLK